MKTTIVILLFLSLKLYSQVQTVYTYYPADNIYSNNYLNGSNSGKGNSGIGAMNDILGAGLNPAAWVFKSKLQLGAQYMYKLTDKTNTNSNSGHSPFTGTIGLGIKINKHFSTGFIYSNPQSYMYNYGTITVSENGVRVVKDAYSKYVTHSFNVPVNYNWKFRSGIMSLGINFNYSYYANSTNIASTVTSPDIPQELTENLGRFNVQAGFLIRPSKVFGIGLTFTPGFTSDLSVTISDSAYQRPVKFPWKAGIGFEYIFGKSGIKLNADYNYNSNIYSSYYQDRQYINAGAEFPINKRLTIRGGIFSEFEIFRENVIVVHESISWRQIFLTAGATITFPKFELIVSVLDSHISPGAIKNLIFSAGIISDF